MVGYFWIPLGFDIIKGGGVNDGKSQKEDISFGVTQCAESTVFLLACSIPECKIDELAINLYSCGEVIEHGWNIVHWESILCVTDQQACLSDSSIAHHDTLYILHRRHFLCLF